MMVRVGCTRVMRRMQLHRLICSLRGRTKALLDGEESVVWRFGDQETASSTTETAQLPGGKRALMRHRVGLS